MRWIGKILQPKESCTVTRLGPRALRWRVPWASLLAKCGATTEDGSIVAKKRDPGILDPELFLAQIRKVEARLGKLAKIRKSVIN